MLIKLRRQQHPFMDYTTDCSLGRNSTLIRRFETASGSGYFPMVNWDISEFALIVLYSHIFLD